MNKDRETILKAILLLVLLPGGVIFIGYLQGYDDAGFDRLRDWLIAGILTVVIGTWAAISVAKENTNNKILKKQINPFVAIGVISLAIYIALKIIDAATN